jgi:hypothetical protein
MPAVETYFIAWKGQRDGPYSVEQLAALLEKGDIGLLHRVETSTGLMPLKQLLLETDSVRWGYLAGLALPPAAPSANNSSAPEIVPANDAPPTAAATRIGENDAILQIYALCGLCFLLPPLAYWTWKKSRELAARGQSSNQKNLQRLSLGLALGGTLFWLAVWRFW